MISVVHIDSGFGIWSSIVSSDDCEEIIDSFSTRPFTNRRAGIRHLIEDPIVSSVASDPRLVSIAKEFIGPSVIPYRATLFNKSSKVNWLVTWHQDTALPLQDKFDAHDWGPWSIKEGVHYAHAPNSVLSRVVALRLCLDDSTELNGPLRVVPGTHKLGVLSDSQVIEIARENKTVTCTATRGSIIAMRPLLIHASSKLTVDQPRRVLHIEYIDSLTIDDRIRIAIA